MSVQATITQNVTAVETLDENMHASAASRSQVTHDGFNTTVVLNSTSTPPASEVGCFEQDLTAGAATIDLTAMPSTNGATVDGTGKRVQAAKFKNPSDNANNMTITEGASNGYDGFGASFSIILVPGAEVTIFTNDGGTDISGTNKTIDIAGTSTQTLEVSLVLG